MHLYETHIPVKNTKASEAFCRDIVGMPFAYRDPTRDIVFLWVDEKQKGMIGLWGPTTGYGLQNGTIVRSHLAFAVSFEQLQRAIVKLNEHRIETTDFSGKSTKEPSVIGLVPSAQIYFSDPNGHSLEFISILPNAPNASFIGSHSDWVKLEEK